jgi:hypothetical protein
MQFPCKKTCREKHPGCRRECLMYKTYREQQAEIKKARDRENLLNAYVCGQLHKSGFHIRRTIWSKSK